MIFRLGFPALLLIFLYACSLFLSRACLAANPQVAADDKPVRDKWAIVVGISKFQNKKIPALKYAAKDARDFRDFLVNQAHFAPDHVRLLLDEKASQRRVLSELGNKFMARVAKPDDLVVIYFSTHGSPSQADIRGENYIVAYDSDPEDLFSTGIEMDKILESIDSRVLSKRVLLVLDACHSGVVTPGAKGMIRAGNFDADKLPLGSGQMVISSSAPEQLSWESRRYENGIFTRKLLEGLRCKGEKTTLSDAFAFLSDAVLAEAQEDYAAKQTPLLRSKWKGEALVLAVPSLHPQSLPDSVRTILEPDSTVLPTKLPDTVRNKQAAPESSTARKADKNLYSSAVALFNKGDYASCIEKLQESLSQKSGNTADAHYTLANAFVKINKFPDAVKHYRESFALNPHGKRADYCLQMINYYSGGQAAARSTARSNTSRASVNTALTVPSQSGAAQSFTDASDSASISSAILEQMDKVKTRLPQIKAGKRGSPALGQIMSWSLQERANYVGEASSRVELAQRQVQDGENLLKRAESLSYSLVPSSRAYGETDEQFKVKRLQGEKFSKELLEPYKAELKVRTGILSEETEILQACQSAASQLSQGNIYLPRTNYTQGNTGGCK